MENVGEETLQQSAEPEEHRAEPRKSFGAAFRREPVVAVGQVDEAFGHAGQITGEREKQAADKERDTELAERVGVAGEPAVGLAVGAKVGGDPCGQRAVLPRGESERGEGRGKE